MCIDIHPAKKIPPLSHSHTHTHSQTYSVRVDILVNFRNKTSEDRAKEAHQLFAAPVDVLLKAGNTPTHALKFWEAARQVHKYTHTHTYTQRFDLYLLKLYLFCSTYSLTHTHTHTHTGARGSRGVPGAAVAGMSYLYI